MIVLFLVFLLQFSLACACLAVNSEQEMRIASSAWSMADNSLKSNVQYKFDCCGFQDASLNSSVPMGHPACDGVSYMIRSTTKPTRLPVRPAQTQMSLPSLIRVFAVHM